MERVVASRFDEHVETQHLLPDQQSAYRATYSTETAVIAVHDAILRAIDSGEVCALVLLDLSSAFDTVDHDTLLHIMNQRFGVDGLALAWFGSYLADRTQVFHYDTQRSAMDLTQSIAVCHKGQSWVQKNSSRTQKN